MFSVDLLAALHRRLLAVVEVQSPALLPGNDLAIVPRDRLVARLGALVTLLTLLPLNVSILLNVNLPTLLIWNVLALLSGNFGTLLVVNCLTFLLRNLNTNPTSYHTCQNYIPLHNS